MRTIKEGKLQLSWIFPLILWWCNFLLFGIFPLDNLSVQHWIYPVNWSNSSHPYQKRYITGKVSGIKYEKAMEYMPFFVYDTCFKLFNTYWQWQFSFDGHGSTSRPMLNHPAKCLWQNMFLVVRFGLWGAKIVIRWKIRKIIRACI